MDFDLFEKSDRDRSLDKDQLAEAGNGQENTGRWKKGEHEEFLRGMELHGKVSVTFRTFRTCPSS
jgi:hypothetical protein